MKTGIRYMMMLLLWCMAATVSAQQKDPRAEVDAAFQAANKVATMGPAEIKLADQAVLKIAKGQAFIPEAEGGRLMQAMGNRIGEGLLGLVMSTGEDNWFVVARNLKAGYIKDEDAKNWKSDELLQNLKDGTEQANAERRSRGIPEMQVLGWVQAPTYDPANQRLVWSLQSKDKGAPDSADRGVNYNTYALGRDGYISLNLVTSMKTVEQDKVAAHGLLSGLTYNQGKRYADFNSSTDKIAEYGLAALVGGVVAKKLGLLAVIGAFLLKSWKLGLLGVVGVGAIITKLFGKKKET